MQLWEKSQEKEYLNITISIFRDVRPQNPVVILNLVVLSGQSKAEVIGISSNNYDVFFFFFCGQQRRLTLNLLPPSNALVLRVIALLPSLPLSLLSSTSPTVRDCAVAWSLDVIRDDDVTRTRARHVSKVLKLECQGSRGRNSSLLHHDERDDVTRRRANEFQRSSPSGARKTVTWQRWLPTTELERFFFRRKITLIDGIILKEQQHQ